MNSHDLHHAYLDLTTAHVADAVIRLGIPARSAPTTVRSARENTHIVGRARPARHYGSVDVFLEALESAEPGDVLVVDNRGRDDEACVGDLIAREVQRAGLSGIVIWGLHRDTAELREIGLAMFSQGSLPVGPQRVDEREADSLTSARVGGCLVTSDDFVLGDDDGVLFISLAHAAEVAEVASTIRDIERRQAARMRSGVTFREQVDFSRYLEVRDRDGVTFRQFLRSVDGAIEE